MKLPSRMTIHALAKKAGVPVKTMWRRIHALDESQGDVLVAAPARKHRVVDTERLLSLCDDFFGKHVALPSEQQRRLVARLCKLEREIEHSSCKV